MLCVDIGDDIADEADIDSKRDIHVDHYHFNLVDNSRIARESPTSSQANEEGSPCP